MKNPATMPGSFVFLKSRRVSAWWPGPPLAICKRAHSVLRRAAAICRCMTRRRQPVRPRAGVTIPDRPRVDDVVPDASPRRARRPSNAARAEAGRRAQRRRSTFRLGGLAGVGLAIVGLVALGSGVGQADVGVSARLEGGVGVHLPSGAALPQRNRPPSSGPHYAGRAAYGAFESPVPPGDWVHVLEHGGVAVVFKCADATECGATAGRLRTEVYDQAGNGAFGERKLVITPYQEMDSPIAAVAWGRILELHEIDAEQILAFYNRYLDRGPERAP